MRLKRPPVEEVGLDFQFDPNPEKRPWALDVVTPFLAQFGDTLPHCEIIQAEEIRIEKRSEDGIPEAVSGRMSLDHVRAHDDDETRWLHVGNDVMSYRLVRRVDDYPGFKAVWQESQEKLTHYVEYFQPTAVRRSRLRYVDVVDIPQRPGGGIVIEDYFQLGVTLPDDPFGPLGEFAVRYSFPRSDDRDAAQLVFSTQPARSDAVVSFRMQWYSICEDLDTLEPEVLTARLDAAHEHVTKCFFASFTSRGLALFEPEEGPAA